MSILRSTDVSMHLLRKQKTAIRLPDITPPKDDSLAAVPTDSWAEARLHSHATPTRYRPGYNLWRFTK